MTLIALAIILVAIVLAFLWRASASAYADLLARHRDIVDMAEEGCRLLEMARDENTALRAANARLAEALRLSMQRANEANVRNEAARQTAGKPYWAVVVKNRQIGPFGKN